jgi:hypothetical protein
LQVFIPNSSVCGYYRMLLLWIDVQGLLSFMSIQCCTPCRDIIRHTLSLVTTLGSTDQSLSEADCRLPGQEIHGLFFWEHECLLVFKRARRWTLVSQMNLVCTHNIDSIKITEFRIHIALHLRLLLRS